MTTSAAMQSLGNYGGRTWFWASGRFEKPGLYYWDQGKQENVWVDLDTTHDGSAALIAAFVRKAGGEITLDVRDLIGLDKPHEQIEVDSDGRGEVTYRLVDPNAPVDGDFYWIRCPSWIVARRRNGLWWMPGASIALENEQVVEVGDRVPPPAGITAGSKRATI